MKSTRRSELPHGRRVPSAALTEPWRWGPLVEVRPKPKTFFAVAACVPWPAWTLRRRRVRPDPPSRTVTLPILTLRAAAGCSVDRSGVRLRRRSDRLLGVRRSFCRANSNVSRNASTLPARSLRSRWSAPVHPLRSPRTRPLRLVKAALEGARCTHGNLADRTCIARCRIGRPVRTPVSPSLLGEESMAFLPLQGDFHWSASFPQPQVDLGWPGELLKMPPILWRRKLGIRTDGHRRRGDPKSRESALSHLKLDRRGASFGRAR